MRNEVHCMNVKQLAEVCMGINEINVRFFFDGRNGFFEVQEYVFVAAVGEISYNRHTVFENGVRQICLTKVIEK